MVYPQCLKEKRIEKKGKRKTRRRCFFAFILLVQHIFSHIYLMLADTALFTNSSFTKTMIGLASKGDSIATINHGK